MAHGHVEAAQVGTPLVGLDDERIADPGDVRSLGVLVCADDDVDARHGVDQVIVVLQILVSQDHDQVGLRADLGQQGARRFDGVGDHHTGDAVSLDDVGPVGAGKAGEGDLESPFLDEGVGVEHRPAAVRVQ